MENWRVCAAGWSVAAVRAIYAVPQIGVLDLAATPAPMPRLPSTLFPKVPTVLAGCCVHCQEFPWPTPPLLLPACSPVPGARQRRGLNNPHASGQHPEPARGICTARGRSRRQPGLAGGDGGRPCCGFRVGLRGPASPYTAAPCAAGMSASLAEAHAGLMMALQARPCPPPTVLHCWQLVPTSAACEVHLAGTAGGTPVPLLLHASVSMVNTSQISM